MKANPHPRPNLSRVTSFTAALLAAAPLARAETLPWLAEARTLLTTAGDPADNLTAPGEGFDGVARLTLSKSNGLATCSGTLLSGGRDILTAAHCLTDGQGVLNTNSAFANFLLPGDTLSLRIADFIVHPDWDGDFDHGNDIALISLTAPAPAAIPAFDIFRGNDEVGQIFTLAGFGQAGQGDQGAVLPAGTRRTGENRFDALGDVFANAGFNPLPGAQLAFDFDNGSAQNDAFNFFAPLLGPGLGDRGVGDNEVMAAPGDSGGPAFINGQIAGVTSFGARLFSPVRNDTSDVDATLNASFGEFGVSTRVSFFADWIDANRSPLTDPLPGDLNADGFVGIEDLNLVLQLWNRDTTTGVGVADPSADGFVGIGDLNIVLGNWNVGTPPGAAGGVPEPGARGLLVVGGVALLRRRA